MRGPGLQTQKSPEFYGRQTTAADPSFTPPSARKKTICVWSVEIFQLNNVKCRKSFTCLTTSFLQSETLLTEHSDTLQQAIIINRGPWNHNTDRETNRQKMHKNETTHSDKLWWCIL